MASTTHTPHTRGIRRFWHNFCRTLYLTIGYFRNIPEYARYQQFRHYITGPLRMARADYTRKQHRKQKQEQAVLNPFLPAAIPCSKHGPQYASGFSDATTCPQCLREQKQESMLRLWAESTSTGEPGAFTRAYKHQHVDTIPTVKMTEQEMQEARFLLDQQEEDRDRTERRPAIKKAG